MRSFYVPLVVVVQSAMETAKMKGDRINAVYLKDEFGGFAVHLLQR